MVLDDSDLTQPPVNEGCNLDTDCCTDTNEFGEDYQPVCGPAQRCTSGYCDAPCSGNADCQEGYSCILSPDPTFPQVLSCQQNDTLGQPDYEICNPPIIVK